MGKRNRVNNNQIYINALPIILSTDKYGRLPQIYPHNPVSWLYFAFQYINIQTRSVPQSHVRKFQVDYDEGVFKVTDEEDMRSLWKQGFFGKGTLSRSDPSWKTRTSRRLNLDEDLDITSEEITRLRREERKKFKTERSKLQDLELKQRQNIISDTELHALEELRRTLNAQRLENPNYKQELTQLEDFRIEDQKLINEGALIDLEYLQLQKTEVFFLRFALNVINVNLPLPQLFSECCAHDISPNNSFILEYVVYHHYRSLGWCVRSGIKFGCNMLLYKRGPPFSHAEHAILIMSDNQYDWSSISSISRVIGGVKKNLVLTFIDIPSAEEFDAVANSSNLSENEKLYNMFKLYKITEILYRRWIPSRNRD
ncbi:uncharacterized protein AC631_05953 [Debaryomyces fabryi]|uniref:tRNA-splicing endonuclease subunit Sen2 n=1 Tax=Debaryomyces fabryi TaxID=58627 RepID=A0A0V1PQ49_9ASCO|nr:uncharacterized protein AC631_05953 [Debaryomyces fabryi]KRZ98287.1 hypothetical protein AC631_05953 [Debaryomyces fabryi]CUM46144.1 unnamed protein product [Debaryomyces fabryi]